MLQKILMIGALIFCGIMSVQATETKEDEKELIPGVFVCNEEESKCSKNGEQEESSTPLLFSVFFEGEQEEVQLFACKNCR